MTVIGLRNAPKPVDLWVTPAGWPAPIRMGMQSPARTSRAEPWAAMRSKASRSTPLFQRRRLPSHLRCLAEEVGPAKVSARLSLATKPDKEGK